MRCRLRRQPPWEATVTSHPHFLLKAKASPTGLGPPEGASHGTFPSVTLSTGTGSAGLILLNVPWRPGDRELAGALERG